MSAPSFSSFPPAFSSFPDLESGPSASSSHSREGPKQREKSKKDRSERERERRKREKHKHNRVEVGTKQKDSGWTSERVQEDERYKAEEDRRQRDDEGQSSSLPLYFSDRKGDALNVQYGGLHAGDIPKYHLVNRGRKILGLDNAWTVVHRSGKGVEITVGNRRRLPTLTDSSSRALLAAPPKRRLYATANARKYEEIDGFLRLPSGRGRQSDQAYRSIAAAKDGDSDSQSSASESEAYDSSDDDSGPQFSSHELRLKDLEGQLSSDSSFTNTWLSLLAHSLSAIPVTSKNATKARSEITLSILSRALSAHPHNASSKVLRLKYLKAGEEVWHESKLKAEWESALKIGGIEVWMEWLGWKIRKALGGIDDVVEDATRAYKAFGDREEDEISKLRLLWRVAVAFEQAGFHERATALFQAQAELTFQAPKSLLGQSFQARVDALEEFWESETPRAGEPDANGWATWAVDRSEDALGTKISTNHSASMQVDSQMTEPYQEWYQTESTSDKTMRLPARSTDERSEMDPYATVLLSDIRPLLLPLNFARSLNVFRLIWLSFLGLHIPGFVDSLSVGSWDDRWCFTHLTAPHSLSSIFPSNETKGWLIADSHAGVLIGREKEYSSAFGPVKEWRLGILGPLDWVGKERWRMFMAHDIQNVDCEFVRAIFKQLRSGLDDYDWDVYALAFEAALNPKDATKLSRSFLSTARDSLPHWAAHARLERLRGRINDARKVYQTVLTASPLNQTNAFVGQLWWDWTEMEWVDGDENAALQIISRSIGLQGSNHVTILRAKRNLDDAAKANFSRWEDQEAWVKLRATIEVLTSSPAAALAIFDSYPYGASGSAGEEDKIRESLMTASLTMIYNHTVILRRPCPPSLLRERLQIAVEAFPNNTIMLGMFLEMEKGQGVWGRVRSLLGQNTVDGGMCEKGVARRAAEVWIAGWEKGRWEGEIERTRSGLAAAAESERTRASPVIWRIILELEIRAGQLQRAKSMLYRAIGECPLSKELYLLAFGPLRSVFAPHELNGFGDTMAERGVRMRVGLDEFLEGQEVMSRGREEDDSDAADADEIEEEARERRRLMPY
ncbi:hypothetical protein SERLA73DRAFT_164712 [Serpula lacrymans var. lacrymans S7.3]|uniref:DUF1740-domain-containing protein n=2 Tax=Serpula lacrymans var. lacrymans TaxID=341189 RepID=F8PIC0_SERL3|nr:uncharacterized protein SERLADRAFT_444471 [Serpula lacrymans var. lacrymans S7.9]EGO05163.1 hypothetical protein SERLA73DRAFT_164712 [Serpula lacrymans var. lacrymans S7.3]EGO30904.1 hypothetical protein SERLADRAFT_444471 [Serpula lacrymans var. lacrymans S7.9]